MTLTVAGCTRLFESARTNVPKPWEGRAACRGCPVGARNAGRPVASLAAMEAVEELRTVCPRCQRNANRMVKDELCVSCYNRDREAVRGFNAKGGRPVLCDKLHSITLAVSSTAGTRIVTVERVVSLAEAILRISRKATSPLTFGRPRMTPADWGAEPENDKAGTDPAGATTHLA